MERLKKELSPLSIYRLLALSAVFFILLRNAAFLWSDHTPVGGDETLHLEYAHTYFQHLKTGPASFLFSPPTFYSPLVYFVTSFFFLIFGPSIKTAILSQGLFILLLAFSLYGMGLALKDEKTGFFTLLIGLSVPLAVSYYTSYWLDVPLAAALAFSIFTLIKSRFFREPFWTLLFFFSMALGFLVKITFLIYITVPLLIALAHRTRETVVKMTGKDRIEALLLPLSGPVTALLSFLFLRLMLSNQLKKVVIEGREIDSSLTGFVVFDRINLLPPEKLALAWFLSLLPLILLSVFLWIRLKDKPALRAFSLGWPLFFALIWHFYAIFPVEIIKYSQKLRDYGMGERSFTVSITSLGVMLLFFSVVGTVLFILDREKKPDWYLTFGGAAGVILFLFLSPVRDVRYSIPLIVLLAPVAALSVSSLKNNVLRRAAAVLCIYACSLGLFGWLLVKTPLASFLVYPGSLARFNPSGSYLLLSDLPMEKSFGIPTATGAAGVLNRGGKGLIITVSSVGRVGREVHSAIPSYYLYSRGNKLYDLTAKLFPEESRGNPGAEEGYDFSAFSEDENSENIKDFDRLIVVSWYDSDILEGNDEEDDDRAPAADEEIMPPKFKEKLERMGIGTKPILLLPPGEGTEETIDVHIFALPLKQ